MTIATFIPIMLGRRVGLLDRIRLAETLNLATLKGVMMLAKYVLGTVLIAEGTGALILFLRFLRDMPPLKAIYAGIFHAVSAFCNAGFDVMGSFSGPFSSITAYRGDWIVNLTIMALIVVGGIGFMIIANLVRHFRYREPLSLHTKVVLLTTLALVLAGALAIFLLELSNPRTLGPLPLDQKILASFFQSVTPRTAGFNTVDIGSMNVSTLMLIVLLMFVGASPGGTGGGVKTSTLAVILATIRSTVRGYSETVIFNRRIETRVIRKALSILVIAFSLIILISVGVSLVEPFAFHQIVFEVVSGFGTVGLSTGITPFLTIGGKLFIIFIVFAGRVGPLSLFIALAQRRREPKVKYPEETIIVG